MTERVDHQRTPASPVASTELTVRRVATEAEYQECVDLQHEIWGADYTGTVPTVILSIAQRVGGVVAGAFDDRGASSDSSSGSPASLTASSPTGPTSSPFARRRATRALGAASSTTSAISCGPLASARCTGRTTPSSPATRFSIS